MGADLVGIEVAWATPDEQLILTLDVPQGTTIEDAITRSGILERCPEIELSQARVGIWSKLRTLDDPVHAGDRIEIYRALKADPKQARKQRAKRRETAQPD